MVSRSVEIDKIIRGIRDSSYELDTESRLARVGLKDEQDSAGVLEKYAWLYNPETVHWARDAYEREADTREHERLRRAYYFLLDGYVSRQSAEQEDRVVSFEMNAMVEVDGETIPYHNVPALLAREPNIERRDRMRDATLDVVEQSNPSRAEIVARTLSTLASEFGYEHYTDYNRVKKRTDYGVLLRRMEDFLVRTEETYARLMGRWAETKIGRPLGSLGSHHFSFISRVPEYDEHFTKERLAAVYQRTLQGMGLDNNCQPNIHLDLADRPKKNPRACCYAPDPPGEVHLIIKPLGGLDDYAAFFHEAGHAQHYGNVDPSLAYVDRAIGTSYALTEIYSFLMQFLTVNPSWLRDVVGLPQEIVEEVVYYTKLSEFYLVRRYVAKLRYELAFYERPSDHERNRTLYSAGLRDATQFHYAPANYLNDMDGGYYSADYLRAWLTEAMLRRHLESTYGEAWYRAPEAGDLLRSLWATGESRENEDIARMIGHEPLDPSCLADQFLSLAQDVR
ncbi:MAG: hypothetical protein M3506_03055 [Chloroflexota bacterium]|nr:hypothetical protein [Chloroflexota bacterium]